MASISKGFIISAELFMNETIRNRFSIVSRVIKYNVQSKLVETWKLDAELFLKTLFFSFISSIHARSIKGSSHIFIRLIQFWKISFNEQPYLIVIEFANYCGLNNITTAPLKHIGTIISPDVKMWRLEENSYHFFLNKYILYKLYKNIVIERDDGESWQHFIEYIIEFKKICQICKDTHSYITF